MASDWGHALRAAAIVALGAAIVITMGMLATVRAQEGLASYYGGGRVACRGHHYGSYTAAHRTLPCGTVVSVTNKRNGQSVTVTIVDRGPFKGGRIIDLSRGAGAAIGMLKAGIVPVSIEIR